MLRLILPAILLFFGSQVFAQAGIYKSGSDFQNKDIFLVGELTKTQVSEICFIWSYAQVEYQARDVWGYRDTLDADYRSINQQFYKIENDGPVWHYTLSTEAGVDQLISYGLDGEIVELNPKSLQEVLQFNEALDNEFKKLKKSEKDEYLVNFLNRFNRSYKEDELSMNK